MSADRDEPHRPSHRLMLLLVSCVVAGSLLFASRRMGDEAFTGMAPMTSRAALGGARAAAAPSRPANGAAFAALNLAGCLALFAASALRRPVQPKPRGKQMKVVYAGPMMATQHISSPVLTVPRTACLASMAEDLMSMPVDSEDEVFKATCMPAASPLITAVPEQTQQDSRRPSFGHNAARRIGGCRHRASRCRRQAFSSDAHERRRVGAQIQAPCSFEPSVVPRSFEPSRVRTRIQIGLRTSRPRTERRQEPNAVLSSDGVSLLEGISCLACYTMLQYKAF